jgi:general secretion pathway protein N
MKRYGPSAGLAVGFLVLAGVVTPIAAPPPTVDLSEADDRSDFFGNRPPHARNGGSTPVVPAAEQVRPGNPLWAIPLKELTTTRERPIFSSTRRPPPPVLPPAPYVPPPPAKPAGPERPQLVLVGTVVNSGEGFGIFLDQATNTVVRLKTGESHNGWILRSVQGRQVTLEKDRDTAMLALPARDSEQPEGHPVVVPPAPPSGERFRTKHQRVDD